MWTVSGLDVINMRTPGGERFLEVVDALLRSHATQLGVPGSEVLTNQRYNIADGGVDTEIRSGSSADPVGWMAGATCWQLKCMRYADVSDSDLKSEIAKFYVRDLIARNFAYRLCICDDMPASKVAEWEAILLAGARDVSSSAQVPRVVTASGIASWLARYPALIRRYFRASLPGAVLDLVEWRRQLSQATTKYVAVSSRAAVVDAIKAHIDLAMPTENPVLPISGHAGVGKSRLVAEALSSVAGAEGVVLALVDEQAMALCLELAQSPESRAIIVVDECSLETRLRIEGVLAPHAARLRAITIGHQRLEGPGARDAWMVPLSADEVLEVLAENFPHVPLERREGSVALSSGFIQLAADLCRAGQAVVPSGSDIPAAIRGYLALRLGADQLTTLYAFSLVLTVGTSGDVRSELGELCNLLGLDANGTLEHARSIARGPGFIRRAGRYMYVTPEIIASLGFVEAWKRWGEDDADRVLGGLTPSLAQKLRERAARSGSDQAREAIDRFFRERVRGAPPSALSDLTFVKQLVSLVDMQPQTYLPELERLVNDAALMDEGSYVWGGREERQQIVWLLERMASVPEYFGIAERTLLRLALHETDAAIVNNATGVWAGLFRVVLSGTAVPFKDRVELLASRFRDSDEAVHGLAARALAGILNGRSWRLKAPTLVAGRLAPPEWRPADHKELLECTAAVSKLLVRLAHQEPAPHLRDMAMRVALDGLDVLLNDGQLDELREIFSGGTLPDDVMAELVEKQQWYVRNGRKQLPQREEWAAYLNRVEDWGRSLVPATLHGRLLVVLARERRFTSRPDDDRKQEISNLASAFVERPELVVEEAALLTGRKLWGVSVFGYEVGRMDQTVGVFPHAVSVALSRGDSRFLSGYVRGLVSSGSERADVVNQWLDQNQDIPGEVQVSVILAGSPETRPVERIFRLVEQRVVPVETLVNLRQGLNVEIDIEAMRTVLGLLRSRMLEGDTRARCVAQELLAWTVTSGQSVAERLPEEVLADPSIMEVAWAVVEANAADGGEESYWWGRLVEAMAAADVGKAARIASKGLRSRDLLVEQESERVLVRLAQSAPTEVMNSLGAVMMEPEEQWHWFVAVHRSLFDALPTIVVQQWLIENGVEAARRVARHLPPPRIGPQGDPIVPEITEFVLERFEDDDRTFREFSAGVHSFQTYSGDIASQHESDAAVAAAFLNHRLRRVREWAVRERQDALKEAAEWRRRDEEDGVPQGSAGD